MQFLFLIFFFLSGASGLIYEVVWTKLFSLYMGGTTYAISTVLASFMFGLAAGSRYGGKYADKSKKPLLIYGIIEGIIGAYCLSVPFLVKLIPHALSPFYDGYYTSHPLIFGVFRFLLSAIILFVPTFLMGASLPVLASYYASSKEKFGWKVGRLYAVNTLGAGIGAFCAGFYLLPHFGKTISIVVAAAINISIFLVSIIFWKKRVDAENTASKSVAAEKNMERKSTDKILIPIAKPIFIASLIVYGINGFAGMAYQIAWTRALTLSIGSSAYSFSMIVTVFIFGLALGGGIGARASDRISNPAAALAILETLIGFLALLTMIGLGRMPDAMFASMGKFSSDWNKLISMEFLFVAVLLILPSITMGAIFPFAMKIAGSYRSGVGEPVGLAYGINTLGAIAGCVIGGFVMIPALGLQHTISAINALNWAGGAGLLAVSVGGSKLSKCVKSASPLLAGLIITFAVPDWNTSLMVSGPFLYPEKLSNEYTIEYHKEDVDATVTVLKYLNKDILLRVNGKNDASTSIDMATQKLSGHLPMLLHKNPKKIFVLGLASGITLGSVTRYPSVESVDMLEISKAVVEASDKFADWNYLARRDPRVNTIVADGRNHLLMTKKKYDVIISEPSNPWMSGISSLFTKEYFDIVSKALLPGGVFCMWMQGYSISPDDFRLVMRTFCDSFPECTLWETYTGTDYIIIGSKEPLRFNGTILEGVMSEKNVADDLKKVNIETPAELMGYFVMATTAFTESAGKGALHRDDNLSLEYSAPKNLLSPTDPYPELYDKVLRFKEHPKIILSSDIDKWPAEFAAELENQHLARSNFEIGMVYFSQGRMDMSLGFITAAVQQAPNNDQYKSFFRDNIGMLSADSWKKVNHKEAFEFVSKGMEILPDESLFYSLRASFYMSSRQVDLAYEDFKKAVALNPNDYVSLFNLGHIELTAMRDFDLAEADFKKALSVNPQYARAIDALGNLENLRSKPEEAERYFRKAIETDPNFADAYLNLAVALLDNKNEAKRKEAIRLYKKAVSLNPEIENDERMRKMFSENPK